MLDLVSLLCRLLFELVLELKEANELLLSSQAWTRSSDEVIAFYSTSPETGLSPQQIKQNEALYGKNGEWYRLCRSSKFCE